MVAQKENKKRIVISKLKWKICAAYFESAKKKNSQPVYLNFINTAI